MPEDNPQNPQTAATAPPAAALLIPLLGIPLALHALTGAAIGGLTFTAASFILGPARAKIFEIPGLLPAKSAENPKAIV